MSQSPPVINKGLLESKVQELESFLKENFHVYHYSDSYSQKFDAQDVVLENLATTYKRSDKGLHWTDNVAVWIRVSLVHINKGRGIKLQVKCDFKQWYDGTRSMRYAKELKFPKKSKGIDYSLHLGKILKFFILEEEILKFDFNADYFKSFLERAYGSYLETLDENNVVESITERKISLEKMDKTLEDALFNNDSPKDGQRITVTTDYENHVFHSEEVYDNEILVEGSKIQVTVNIYERNPIARQKCLDHYGYDCSVCTYNFYANFGEIGQNFIHVHHLKEISQIGEKYVVDPIEDLRPVCPNCHSMLHKRKPAFSIKEMKDILNQN